MKDPTTGAWLGFGLGDVDPKVAEIQKFLAAKFASYAGHLVPTGTYDQATADVVAQMQARYGLPATGIFDFASQVKSGFYKPAPAKRTLPLFFSVEGHLSDQFHGPVADTATILEQEGRCIHRPTGYNNGAIPFDNLSGENELARRVGQTVQDDGVQFPAGTKWLLADFSQGGIIATDFEINHLLPGCDLAWRTPDYLGRLSYGNPTRSAGSVAPWSRNQAGPAVNFGLDPLVRFDKLGITMERPHMDVYRKGDIFSDNEPTKTGDVKAAVYQAVARADLFSDPYSIVAQIADLFTVPFDEVWAMLMAIISGIGFLATGDQNPHYSPYNLDGGIDWCRSLLTAGHE